MLTNNVNLKKSLISSRKKFSSVEENVFRLLLYHDHFAALAWTNLLKTELRYETIKYQRYVLCISSFMRIIALNDMKIECNYNREPFLTSLQVCFTEVKDFIAFFCSVVFSEIM